MPDRLVFGVGPGQGLVLESGWSEVESSEDEWWVWATSVQASVSFDLATTDLRRLAIRLRASPARADEPQAMELWLNGDVVAAGELLTGRASYAIDLPRDRLREGPNRLELRFRWVMPPPASGGGSAETRPLAAALEAIELERLPAGRATSTPRHVLLDRPEAWVRLGRETRPGVVGEAARATVDLSRDRWLEVPFGLVCPEEATCAGPWTFGFGLESEGSVRRLGERTVDAAAAASAWRTERLLLPPGSGVATLRLDAAVGSGGGSVSPGAPGEGRPVWGTPWTGGSGLRPWNVLLVSVDTLRADHLGCYGYPRPTSPHLDRLARVGARFAQAVSQAPWTTPSHMSLFTSRYPSSHGVNQGFRELSDARQGTATYRTLAPAVPTLAALLRAAGYRTVAMTGGATVSADLGFARGFDRYEEGEASPFDRLGPAAEARLEALVTELADEPFFLFFHTFEVHAPYARLDLAGRVLDLEALAGLEGLFAADGLDPIGSLRRHLTEHDLYRPEVTTALYDGGVRHTDGVLGRLFALLGRLGLWDDTVVIVISDHGEELADHDPNRFYDAHCSTGYEELLHVPLILRVPGGLGRGVVVPDPVELVDVAPTVLELLGLPIPPSFEGASLVPLLRGHHRADSWAMAEATCVGPEIKVLRGRRSKLLAAFRPEEGERTGWLGRPEWEEAFDLELDPGEQQPDALRPEVRRELRERLRDRLEAAEAAREEQETGEMDDALRRELEALGYLGS